MFNGREDRMEKPVQKEIIIQLDLINASERLTDTNSFIIKMRLTVNRRNRHVLFILPCISFINTKTQTRFKPFS